MAEIGVLLCIVGLEYVIRCMKVVEMSTMGFCFLLRKEGRG